MRLSQGGSAVSNPGGATSVAAGRGPVAGRGGQALIICHCFGDGTALAVEVNLFGHTYNTLRPHRDLGERTRRAAYLPVEHCD